MDTVISQGIKLENVLNEIDLDDSNDDSNDEGSNDDNGFPYPESHYVYTELIANAVSPIVEKAQLEMASKIARKFNLDEKEVEAVCISTGSRRPSINGVNGNDSLPTQRMSVKRKPSSKGTSAEIQTRSSLIILLCSSSGTDIIKVDLAHYSLNNAFLAHNASYHLLHHNMLM